ncbi:MAG: aminodeoxychorismate synthase component I [Acidobacteriota bacterium]|nr:aminodeoxychorismate synthase component I [Acidobacteriota bacterium]
MRILIVDNYDSFTYNLYHLAADVLGQVPLVKKNDELTLAELAALDCDAIILSPGPGHPARERDFGICAEILRSPDIPVLGICLGHQGIGYVSGASVQPAKRVVHGLSSPIFHNGAGLFSELPQGFSAVRYHSLIVASPLPAELEEIAWTSEGEIMALRHRSRPYWGVQFHPESIRSEYGRELFANFIRCSAEYKSDPRSTVHPAWPTYDTPQEDTQPEARRVLHRNFGFYVEPEDVYSSLFSQDANSFWLDSALVQPGLSRHSFMGGSSIPGSFLLDYNARSSQLTIEENGQRTIHQQKLFDYLKSKLSSKVPGPSGQGFHSGFLGYFGYELKGDCGYSIVHSSDLPDSMLLYTPAVLAFDQRERSMHLYFLEDDKPREFQEWEEALECKLRNVRPSPLSTVEAIGPFTPRHSAKSYIEKINQALAELAKGESYEICLTNIFIGPPVQEPLALYRKLRKANPAPYAAFLKFGEVSILSSSPERFLRIAPDGTVTSKPIKGTSPRYDDPALDKQSKQALAASAKDSAEHLMIVDLIRNDLGKVCNPGSVSVPKFSNIESYAHVHQLVSTVQAQLHPECTAIDCLFAAFPGGSMTGAPKARTLEILDRLEEGPRGIYSGCLGYIGLDGCADLNIVIRTLVVTPNATRIGSGGAIVMLSDPAQEFEEMQLKIEPLLRLTVTQNG